MKKKIPVEALSVVSLISKLETPDESIQWQRQWSLTYIGLFVLKEMDTIGNITQNNY